MTVDIEELLGARDIYDRLVPAALDLQGWGGQPEFFREMVERAQPELIIEVGTWKGKSAVAMADALACLAQKPPGKVVCVDTWLGATEFIGKPDDDPKRGLMRHCGWPQVYYQFLSNVVHCGHQHYIIPFPQTSANAARFFTKHGVRAGLIYLDGSHEYEDVKADLNAYYPLLTEGGIIFGDDYCEHWDGVRRAVDAFAWNRELRVETRRYPNGEGEAPSDYWILSR